MELHYKLNVNMTVRFCLTCKYEELSQNKGHETHSVDVKTNSSEKMQIKEDHFS